MRRKYLAAILLSSSLFADEITTNNLLINSGFDNGTNGWTLSGEAVRINDCCPGGHDLEFGGSGGSIEQSFNLTSDSITQPMLNNGITLNSSVETQNGECEVSGCWGGSGAADPFTIRLQIRDENQNVLAVTTQERYDVTGISGEVFSNSVSYTGTDSNIGNIFISGSDSNNSYLGGPNVDNISVTMTYDDTVLSVTQTQELNTTFGQIEEVIENKIEKVEFEPIEEIIFIPFEEPEIKVEKFEEIFIQELTTEEINTGIVNVFNLPPPGEITEVAEIEEFEELPEITMEEQQYEEPKNIETFSTEVESEKELSETGETETTNLVEEETGGGNEPASERNEERTAGEPNSESETVARNEGETQAESNEQGTGREESEPGESGASVASDQTESIDDDAVATDSQDQKDISIDIADVQDQVAKQIKSIDRQIAVTQMIVAKVMQDSNKMIDSYGSLNENIFKNQLEIDGGTLDDFYTRDYSDGRNLYTEIKNPYSDRIAEFQKKIDKATEDRIRAEEHLRRIRGF